MKCKICGKEMFYFRKHLKEVHNLTDIEYYTKYVNNGITPVCKYCGKPVTKFKEDTFSKGPVEYCSTKCRHMDHSNIMKKLHKCGVYKGTSKISEYNKSNLHKEVAKQKAKERRLDKNSIAFNSEYSDRIRNKDNIRRRYKSTDNRYLYVLEYEDKIKVGSTSRLDRRLSELKGFNNKYLFKGTVFDISQLECDVFLTFKNKTLLDKTHSYYTEYLEKDCLNNILTYIKNNI